MRENEWSNALAAGSLSSRPLGGSTLRPKEKSIMGSNISAWTRKHQLVAYFVLACAITWVLVFPLVLDALGLLAIQISPHWHFLGALGPILAALIVTGIANGRSGISEFVGRMGRWRVGSVWLLVAVLSPILLFVVSAIILRAVGNPWPDFSKLASAEYANFGWILGSFLSAIAYGIGEEAGWRGFALPRLQKGHSALSATFILSVFWAIWHIPFFSYRFEFGVGQVIGFFIGLFAGAIWLTFLYNSTRGSILIVATWHAIWNMVNMLGLVASVDVVSLMSALVMVAAVVIVIVWRPARLSVHDKETVPDRIFESETNEPFWDIGNRIF